ncbi:MAG: hypothetical protein OXK79_13220, partial [Chloroflexota bacterium]|nr:hypothetical protein [Chloroflexota bacterium]
MKDRAFVHVITFLAAALLAGTLACSSESEPEDLEPTPTSLPALTGSDLMQLTDDTKTATSSQDSAASRKGSLVIGNLVDTSGPHAKFGESYSRAAELAARHITEAGGT